MFLGAELRVLALLGVLIVMVIIAHFLDVVFTSWNAVRGYINTTNPELASELKPSQGIASPYTLYAMMVFGVMLTIAVIILLIFGHALRRAEVTGW